MANVCNSAPETTCFLYFFSVTLDVSKYDTLSSQEFYFRLLDATPCLVGRLGFKSKR